VFVNRPPGLEQRIGASLEAMQTAESADMHALYTLELLPELANEPAIRRRLLELRTHRWPGVRRSVGRSLALAGCREGLECLTWCVLAVHPVTRRSQREEADSNMRVLSKQYLMPFAGLLDEELVGMIVDDLCDASGNRHLDLLAAAPAALVSRGLEPLLESRDRRLRADAAFVLGRRGRQDVVPILEQELREARNVEPALLAISHIRSDATPGWLEHFESKGHSPYGPLDGDARTIRLTMLARRRRLLLSSGPVDVLDRFFARDYRQYAGDSQSPPRLFHLGRRWGIAADALDENTESAADFVAEFFSPEDRAACVRRQLEAMAAVKKSPAFQPRRVDQVHDFLAGPLTEPKGKFLPGVTLFFDDPDYDFAATDWISNAERYRVGTVTEL
jgi:hypothetical protein